MYSPVSLLSGLYPLPGMHSLIVTFYVTEYFASISCEKVWQIANRSTKTIEKSTPRWMVWVEHLCVVEALEFPSLLEGKIFSKLIF